MCHPEEVTTDHCPAPPLPVTAARASDKSNQAKTGNSIKGGSLPTPKQAAMIRSRNESLKLKKTLLEKKLSRASSTEKKCIVESITKLQASIHKEVDPKDPRFKAILEADIEGHQFMPPTTIQEDIAEFAKPNQRVDGCKTLQ